MRKLNWFNLPLLRELVPKIVGNAKYVIKNKNKIFMTKLFLPATCQIEKQVQSKLILGKFLIKKNLRKFVSVTKQKINLL